MSPRRSYVIEEKHSSGAWVERSTTFTSLKAARECARKLKTPGPLRIVKTERTLVSQR